MLFEVPSRDALLGATTPEQVFGATMADPRALRSAYAALVRAFDGETDPAAFTHARRLYEQARAAPPPSTPDAESPVALFAKARANGDVHATLQLLASKSQVLVHEAPELLGRTLVDLLTGVGPLFGPSALDLVELVVRRPDFALDAAAQAWLEAELVSLRELQRATDDPTVPRPLLSAVRRAWRCPALAAAEAWLAAADALRAEDVDLAATMAHLELHHPSLLGAIRRIELRIDAAAHPSPVDDAAIAGFADRWPPATSLERRAHLRVDRQLPTVLETTLTAGAGVVGGLIFQWFVAGIGVAVLTVALFLYVVRPTLLDRARKEEHADVYEHGTAGLHEVARARGLFPRELARLASVPVDPGRAVPYDRSHPLVAFDDDPAALLSTIGPLHVDRIRKASTNG